MADAVLWATITALLVTVSFPFYLYGAWIIIENDPVTWDVLTRHLTYILAGLVLTTGPVVGWMAPRLFERLSGLRAVHAIFGVQAYAFLLFALTGIVRIFQAKHSRDLYGDPAQDVDIDDLHENMGAWRFRLRIGVIGYVLCWLIAYLLGITQYALAYF
ncbi:DUF7321 family protein [Halalkalicoccus jeotgali]|uniref:DUF7321 domain-containing protein n=1 Tax=Halalkalicoccus jeotgali (strain DSM 18796 / CECT 7217 / JCM 14584 / KCTC 4019 / B3) TaxID=795797 RepID=D8J4Z3_HALJB|nr:hypothetical protein [Halalkalicoccus jeotgali]ADJ15610.1 hypothetical protein HacjB3_11135 [Halalkalicoccus jeotgali B3]ELY36312.1 hypothetical protein C497_11528 [Halalkalicoccus jeotgali B3]